ncbi:Zinc finger PHD-type domain-containing protein [Plasmodiophora brassicae]|uniref:Zinc finger PHD-type domain-containing protein n=1 Tax=Plasmodiophora brassicae TaxID=37360 RepID=A0A0G4IQM8_PLABS|nr:hypothetical protein PBRA_000857 [Plasmodiophora brassicae]SPQ97823.1 unnamed protein product [Plasmodiophora brassicae]
MLSISGTTQFGGHCVVFAKQVADMLRWSSRGQHGICFCNNPARGRQTVRCVVCQMQFHTECIHLESPTVAPTGWSCSLCRPDNTGSTISIQDDGRVRVRIPRNLIEGRHQPGSSPDRDAGLGPHRVCIKSTTTLNEPGIDPAGDPDVSRTNARVDRCISAHAGVGSIDGSASCTRGTLPARLRIADSSPGSAWQDGGHGDVLLTCPDGCQPFLAFRVNCHHILELALTPSRKPVVRYQFPNLIIAMPPAEPDHLTWTKYAFSFDVDSSSDAPLARLTHVLRRVWDCQDRIVDVSTLPSLHDAQVADDRTLLQSYIVALRDKPEFKQYCHLVRRLLRGQESCAQ